MTELRELQTPALVVDAAILERNVRRAAQRARELNVPLRPHVKTPKCVEIARLLLQRDARGICVSTLREAQVMLDAGITDQFYAVELAPQKAPLVIDLQRRGADIKCLCDSLAAAREISARVPTSARLPLLIALDTDGYRCGIAPLGPELLELARYMADSPRLRFDGLMAYAGASYHTSGDSAKGGIAEAQCEAALAAKRHLEGAGIACPTISLGSTPAWSNARRLAGATELRGGIYVFQDLFQAGAGHCDIADISLTVLTTVISVQRARNRFFIDAGGLALSKDRSTAGHAFDAGYGLLCKLDETQPIADWYVADVHQEHGVVTTISGAPLNFSRIELGMQFRVLPNHSDMTAAAYEEYHVIDGDVRVRERWRRFNGWLPV